MLWESSKTVKRYHVYPEENLRRCKNTKHSAITFEILQITFVVAYETLVTVYLILTTTQAFKLKPSQEE